MAFGIGSAIKRTLGSAANKVADKIIPKELAPFLPLLAPAFMGPGAGIMSRYLVPQLLTALSSGKTAGDISGTGQVLTGLGSLLSDPSRMAYSDATKTTSDIVREGPITTPDPVLSPDDLMTVGPDTGPVTGTDLPVTRIGPNTISTAAKPINYDFAASDKNFLDYLKRGVNESRDFMQGTNVANMPMGDEITVGDQSKLIGRPKVDIYDPAYQSAVRDRSALTFDFGKDNALQATGAQATGGTYGVGDDVLVRDAGFFQNLPRRAVAQGIQSIGPASTAIDKYKADQDAEAARLAEEQAAYSNSVADLINYYRSLADPNERFGSYYNQGGLTSLKPKRGLVNEPGGYAGEEDDFVKALIKMIGPLPTTGGNNYQGPSIVGGTDYVDPFQELVDQGFFKVVKNVKQKANGGRVGLNMGGIMNAGSIPQTLNIPKGMQLDGRGGGFIPMGAQEKKDDVPAMLAKNEFVMTSDAVRAAGGGSIEKGAQRMYDMMNQLEAQV